MFEACLIILCVSICYSLIFFFFPPKKFLVERCYEYIMNERKTYRGFYEFRIKSLEKRFSKNIRGIHKYNRRKVAEAVIEKLIQNNIVTLVPDLCFDIYRVVYVESAIKSSIIASNDIKS